MGIDLITSNLSWLKCEFLKNHDAKGVILEKYESSLRFRIEQAYETIMDKKNSSNTIWQNRLSSFEPLAYH